MTDADGLLEDHDAGAMAMAVPGTQQSPGGHPSRPQCVAGLLTQVLGVVIHSHIVAHVPAQNPAMGSATTSSTMGTYSVHCDLSTAAPVLCEFTSYVCPTERDAATTV